MVRSGFSTSSGVYPIYVCMRAGIGDVVLGPEKLCYAAQAVGKISGLVDIEDILCDLEFCVGK